MKKTLLAVALMASLAGCYDNHQPAYTTQYQQPQVVQQAPAVMAAPAPVVVQEHHSGASDMLMGGALGYMLGRSTSAPAPAAGYHGGEYNRTTVNKTVVNKTVIVQNNHPAPVAAPIAKPIPAPTSRFGNAPTSYAAAYNAAKPSTPTRSLYGSYSSARSTSSFSSSRSFGRR